MLKRLLLLALMALTMTLGGATLAIAAEEDPDQAEIDAILDAYLQEVDAIDAAAGEATDELEAEETRIGKTVGAALAAARTGRQARAAFDEAETAIRELGGKLTDLLGSAATDLETAGATAVADLTAAGAPQEAIDEISTSNAEAVQSLRDGKAEAAAEVDAGLADLRDQLDARLAALDHDPAPQPAPDPAPQPAPVQPLYQSTPAQLPFTGSTAALLFPAALAVLGTGLIVVLAGRRPPAR
jgi:hypothetical protein